MLAIAAGIVFLTGIPLGAAIAAMQNATHSRMRGMAGSLQTFAAQSVGYDRPDADGGDHRLWLP